MSAAPKPCPFCGAELERHEAFDDRVMWSHPETGDPDECVIAGDIWLLDESVDRWNRRTPEQPA